MNISVEFFYVNYNELENKILTRSPNSIKFLRINVTKIQRTAIEKILIQ